MDVLTVKEIDKAYDRIKPFIIKTPLITSDAINKITQAKVYFLIVANYIFCVKI